MTTPHKPILVVRRPGPDGTPLGDLYLKCSVEEVAGKIHCVTLDSPSGVVMPLFSHEERVARGLLRAAHAAMKLDPKVREAEEARAYLKRKLGEHDDR